MLSEEDIERFWSRVVRAGPDDCWPYPYAHAHKYGTFWVKKRYLRAAHLAWSLHHNKPWPEGLHALHSCDNPPCANPAHIWPGTPSDNGLDMMKKGRGARGIGGVNAAKTHCPKGHPLAGDNLYRLGRRRRCRECMRVRDKETQRKRSLALRQRKEAGNGNG